MQKGKRKLALILVWALVVPFFTVSQLSFYKLAPISVQATELTLEQIEDAKDKVQKKIEKETKAKALLEKENTQIGSAIFSTQKVINTTKSVIVETDTTIARKEQEIKNLSAQIVLQQQLLKDLIQQAYYVQNQPILKLILLDGKFSDLLSGAQHLTSLDEKILAIVAEINNKKTQIDGDKVELAKKKEAHLEVLASKTEQKQELVADQIEVLGDIADKEATIAELKQKLSELQADLNVVTGQSYNAKDIKDAIEYANGKTGVPNGILFAFLTQESGRGKNVGQCTYDDMEQRATTAYKKYGKAHGWNYKPSIDRLTYRKGLFEDLVSKLNYSKSKKVSCAIIPANFANYEPNQGGAMGVAQFMSDTWMNNGLQSQLMSYTGHKIPDPWSLTDGTMALAIKVRAAGGTSTSSSAIKKMVTTYYGASPDKSSVAKNYYNNILYFVKNYDKLIN